MQKIMKYKEKGQASQNEEENQVLETKKESGKSTNEATNET